jgi:hypothetical protein
MWVQLLIGVGGLVFLATAYAALQELANRRRLLNGECRMDSIRCLGCMATGRCRAREQAAAPSAGRKQASLHTTTNSR